MFESVAQICAHKGYAAFAAHHAQCGRCSQVVKLPGLGETSLESVFRGFIHPQMCSEGLSLARTCLIVDIEPGKIAALPFIAHEQSTGPFVRITSDAITLRTVPCNYAVQRVVGFRCRVRPDAKVLVRDLRVAGDICLFWCGDWMDARTYLPPDVLLLRAKPELCYGAYTVVEVRCALPDDEEWVSCELLVEPRVSATAIMSTMGDKPWVS